MHASILALQTEVPESSFSQENFEEKMTKLLNLKKTETYLLKRITKGSLIKKRHSVVANFLEDEWTSSPKTSRRNDLYKEAAPKLAEIVCHKVLEQWGNKRSDITHIISVSCTGMIAPGIEFLLIEPLGLSSKVERLGINFMGCFGAFKGIAIAKSIALESSKNRILVVCTELCSLHFQRDLSKETMVSNSLFADGAGAVIIGMGPRENEKPLFNLINQASEALPGTTDLMSWEAGDFGYQMRLNALIPSFLEKNISPFVKRLVEKNHSLNAFTWAVHPGGKAILNALLKACQLQNEQLKASWDVLENYGNMSSPTFLFVLNEILKTSCLNKDIIGLGFGPGLSIEGLLLKHVAK
ncbi:type III polyketide synthase [Chlamydiales bacterium]|nr:type III polyketide synthase [Chlamydiales bacterium]